MTTRAATASEITATPSPKGGHPGELVQMDWFCLGRGPQTRGSYQCIAIDISSGYIWLSGTEGRPSFRSAAALAKRVARDLRNRGARLECVMTDNAFSTPEFDETLLQLGVRHTFASDFPPRAMSVVERTMDRLRHGGPRTASAPLSLRPAASRGLSCDPEPSDLKDRTSQSGQPPN